MHFCGIHVDEGCTIRGKVHFLGEKVDSIISSHF